MNTPDKQFNLLVQLASSLSLGLLAGVLYSIEQVHPELVFTFSFGSTAAFAVVTTATWCACRLLMRDNDASAAGTRKSRARVLAAMSLVLLLAAAMFLAFARSLRNVSAAKVREVSEGTAMAVVCLIFLGIVFWRVIRFFNDDHTRWSDPPPEGRPPQDPPPGNSSP